MCKDTSNLSCVSHGNIYNLWKELFMSVIWWSYAEHIWGGGASCGIASSWGQSGFLWMQNSILPGYSAWWCWPPLLLQLLHRRCHRLHMRKWAFPLRRKFSLKVVSLLFRNPWVPTVDVTLLLLNGFSFSFRNAIYIPFLMYKAQSQHNSDLRQRRIQVTVSSTARSQVWGLPF